MKFCDKLPKLRKDNNLSQEQLAELLGVSRQAVSKWESGSSYPDMEKIIAISKILNCTLEDLLDDGTIKSNGSNKFNFNNYVNDFLKFITKIYNMFNAMSFKDKIKCLLEMISISFILYVLSIIVFKLFNVFIFNLFLYIPRIGNYIDFVFERVFSILLFVISFIVLIHIFKIRYLDYYITVEDQNVNKKSIEKPIDMKEMNEKKIIIRDPKHSSFSFFNILTNLVVFIIKLMFLFILLFFLLGFCFLVGIFAIGIYNIRYGIIFFTLTISVLGLLFLCYVLIELVYNFIVSKKQKIKRVFIILLLGFALFGLGIGFSVCIYLNFDKSSNIPSEFMDVNTGSIDFVSDMVIEGDNVIYNIDNSVDNVRFQSKYYDIGYDEDIKNVWYVYKIYDDSKVMRLFYDDLKNGERRDYNNIYDSPIIVTVSRDHYDKLIKNYSKYVNE